MPLFWFSGHNALFFFVICAVLALTVPAPIPQSEPATL
jgi:hypothetical protein